MSNNIEMVTYSLNVDKTKIQEFWDDYVGSDDWQEDSGGLPNNINWVENRVFDTYEDAENYIKECDEKIYYNCMAVQYRDMPKDITSKAMGALKERLQKESDKLNEYTKAHTVKAFKADFVGCAGCGSKLAKVRLLSDKCPLCGADLRGKTTLKTLARYENNIQELNKKIKEEEKKLTIKYANKAEIRWLCKVEYYT